LVRHAPIPATLAEDVRWLEADLCDASESEQVVQSAHPDLVFHLAGHASAAGGRAELHRSNVDATTNLLAAAAHLRWPVRVLVVSSGYVYGECAPGEPATEEKPLHPVGLYAESKAAMERSVLAEEWGDDVHVTIARPFNHTGPRQSPVFAVPAFARQLAAIEAGLAEPVLRVGNLESQRDLGDVRDVVRAYAALGSVASHGECFNICTGRRTRMSDVLDDLIALCRVPVRVMPDPERMRSSDIAVSFGSAAKLASRTGWRPEIPLEQTLRDTLDWWRRDLDRS
jgi:GDP-4-dehydro-6-deoxy-D-mannose reductase